MNDFIRISNTHIVNKRIITDVYLVFQYDKYDVYIHTESSTGQNRPIIRKFDSKDEANKWIINNFGV